MTEIHIGLLDRVMKRAEQKSKPEIREQQFDSPVIGELLSKERTLETGDVLFTSKQRSEEDTREKRVPSSILISPLGRKIISENPGFLRQILSGSIIQVPFPEGDMQREGDDSFVAPVAVTLNGEKKLLAVKVHDEGRRAYPHFTSGESEVIHDHVSGIDNFLAQRAIQKYGGDSRVVVPEPIFATQRLYISELVEGEPIHNGQLPAFVKHATKRGVDMAYKVGWIKSEVTQFGPFKLQKRHAVDFRGRGNVIIHNGKFYMLDPIIST